MKRMHSVLQSKLFLSLLTLFSYAMLIATITVRYNYTMINLHVLSGIAVLMLLLSIATAVLCTVLLTISLVKKSGLTSKFLIWVWVAVGLSILCLGINVLNIIMGGAGNFWTYLLLTAPPALILIGTLFFIFILPKVPKKPRAILSATLITVIFLGVLIPAFKLYGFRFSAEPLVLDTGAGYSVVWATNDRSTGFVRIQDGSEEKIVWNENSGKKAVSKIHSVAVSYDDLDQNQYSVHSTRVRGEYAYGSSLGKQVDSAIYSFRGKTGNDLNLVVASDWHGMVKTLNQTVSHFDRPDLFIMMGDYADDYASEKAVIQNIIAAGAQVTGSECPAVFVRGNHETRGAGGNGLENLLGLESFYYTVERGPYTFLVVDSGEDKPDEHAEYGDLNLFEPYMERQTEWLENLPAPTSRYVITLTHSESYAPAEEMESRFVAQMGRIGAHLVISGHHHVYGITDYATIADNPKNYLQIIDGGKNSADLYKAKYVATQLTIRDGTMRILMKDEYGHVYKDQSVTIGN